MPWICVHADPSINWNRATWFCIVLVLLVLKFLHIVLLAWVEKFGPGQTAIVL